jgi:hypothetical protein
MTQLLTTTLDAIAPDRRSRSRAALLVTPVLALAVACGGVLAARAARPEPREITLVARNMAFYLPGDPTPNPRLVVERGEPVRLLLRNGERGMPHDVAVPDGDGGWDASREVRGKDETAELRFEAPETAGGYEYICTLHARMMRGVLEVR